MLPGDAEELRELRDEYERGLRLIKTGARSWRWVVDDDEDDTDDPKSY